jgi:hypothetical protein
MMILSLVVLLSLKEPLFLKELLSLVYLYQKDLQISLIIKEFPEDILIKLAIVLKISKSS